MEPILSLKNVCSYYDKVQVLYDINVDVYPGEIVSVIGANGAGKSTMMKTIMGLVHMGRGEVTFDGKKLNRMHAHKICKAGIAYVPEGREVFPNMTVLENLEMGAYCRSYTAAQMNEKLDEPSLGLAPVIVDDVFDVIHNINSVKKLPVILVEQNAYMALSISNRCYVLENGRIAHSGKSSELIQSDVIRETYLGG